MMKPLFLTLALTLGGAQAGLAETDVKGSSDHPLISRMPGTYIADYHSSAYQEFSIATGPLVVGADLPPVERFEGSSTVITYRADKTDLSALAIFRNYQKAFAKAGFEMVFTCDSDRECGEKFVRQLYWYGDPQRQGQSTGLDAPNCHGDRHQYFYWSGKAKTADGDYIIALLVAQRTTMNFPAVIVLDVSQAEDLDDDQVGINLEAMTDKIETTGKVVLDGIFFDFDKSTLKPESKDALEVIAGYLSENPARNFFVVGHTDNKGSLDYNRKLSFARAEAVVEALAGSYRIDRKRLSAFGVGPVAPVTSNATETGRAQNRRVEMVIQE